MEEISYKGKEIPIIRQEVEYSNEAKISLYFKGEFYEYKKAYDLNLFLHFVNRHIYPVVFLNSIKAIEKFKNTSQEWVENTPFYMGKFRRLNEVFTEMEKVTRIIAFVAHQSEHKEELKSLSAAAKELGYRDDLRIAKVIDPELVMEYKRKYGEKWFDEGSTNSMVVFSNSKSEESALNYYDLSSETTQLSYWINSASLEHIEKMSIFSLQIMENMNMPIFTAFVDTSQEEYKDESIKILKILGKLAFDYPQYLFGYFDDHKFDIKKKEIGITWDKLPSFALFNPPEDLPVVFPQDKKMNKENLDIFLEKGIEATIHHKPIFQGTLNQN